MTEQTRAGKDIRVWIFTDSNLLGTEPIGIILYYILASHKAERLMIQLTNQSSNCTTQQNQKHFFWKPAARNTACSLDAGLRPVTVP